MQNVSTIVLFLLFVLSAAGTASAADSEKGVKLFNDSSLGTNGKSCGTCHPDGRNIDGSKSSFTILGSQQESLEDAVNFCISMALSGQPLDKESEQMQDLVAYLRSLQNLQKKGLAPGY